MLKWYRYRLPIEFWLVLANSSPGDRKENVVPLSEEAL